MPSLSGHNEFIESFTEFHQLLNEIDISVTLGDSMPTQLNKAEILAAFNKMMRIAIALAKNEESNNLSHKKTASLWLEYEYVRFYPIWLEKMSLIGINENDLELINNEVKPFVKKAPQELLDQLEKWLNHVDILNLKIQDNNDNASNRKIIKRLVKKLYQECLTLLEKINSNYLSCYVENSARIVSSIKILLKNLALKHEKDSLLTLHKTIKNQIKTQMEISENTSVKLRSIANKKDLFVAGTKVDIEIKDLRKLVKRCENAASSAVTAVVEEIAQKALTSTDFIGDIYSTIESKLNENARPISEKTKKQIDLFLKSLIGLSAAAVTAGLHFMGREIRDLLIKTVEWAIEHPFQVVGCISISIVAGVLVFKFAPAIAAFLGIANLTTTGQVLFGGVVAVSTFKITKDVIPVVVKCILTKLGCLEAEQKAITARIQHEDQQIKQADKKINEIKKNNKVVSTTIAINDAKDHEIKFDNNDGNEDSYSSDSCDTIITPQLAQELGDLAGVSNSSTNSHSTLLRNYGFYGGAPIINPTEPSFDIPPPNNGCC